MITFSSDKIAMFDVDDTLVFFEERNKYPTFIQDQCSTLELDGVEYLVNDEMVTLLKEHSRRGHVIVVWSAGGSEWAKRAIDKLGIESFVDAVMAKPAWIYDDLPITNIGRTRWIGPDGAILQKKFIYPKGE